MESFTLFFKLKINFYLQVQVQIYESIFKHKQTKLYLSTNQNELIEKNKLLTWVCSSRARERRSWLHCFLSLHFGNMSLIETANCYARFRPQESTMICDLHWFSVLTRAIKLEAAPIRGWSKHTAEKQTLALRFCRNSFFLLFERDWSHRKLCDLLLFLDRIRWSRTKINFCFPIRLITIERIVIHFQSNIHNNGFAFSAWVGVLGGDRSLTNNNR